MFSQLVFNQLIKKRENNLISKVIIRILEILRKLIIKFNGKRLVRYNLNGIDILIPLKHDLPIIKRIFPFYNSNIGRIARYIKEKYSEFQAVDVGANIGDTAIIIKSQIDVPILCIEGDVFYFDILKKNTANLKNIVYENSFVGADEKVKINFINYKGSARLAVTEKPNQTIELKSLINIVSSYKGFDQIKFLKIDTDGFDCKIIRENVDFIEKFNPVIFFEYDPYFLDLNKDNGLSVFQTLFGLGYNKTIIYTNTGEFLLSLNLGNKQLLEELHLYFSGRKSDMYMDICVFHSEDNDLAERIRILEMDLFGSYKLFNI